MNKNVPPNQHLQESPTAPRYSFMDRNGLRNDSIVNDGYKIKRVITYPTPSPAAQQVSEFLSAHRLVLGRKEPSDQTGLERYLIPTAARPISHDVSTHDSRDYSYNDAAMFNDIGGILGTVARSGEGQVNVLNQGLGRNLAILDFTRIDEAKVLLVPGFEADLMTVNSVEVALNGYATQLYNEFGPQFMANADRFTEGFHAAVS